MALAHVLADEFCHLEHIDFFLSSKDGAQLCVCVDDGAFVGVLEIIFLDVGPELFGHLCAWDWF